MDVVSLPIEKIHISPLNVRAGVEFGDEEDLELIKNVDSLGLIQPIVVRPVGDQYEIVIGSRRYQSLKEAGANEIPCVVRELSDDESLDLSLSENIFKKDVDPITLGRWLKERLSKGDMSLSGYARKIGKS